MSKKIVIPHEHGGWAMVSVPFLIGMMAGTPRWTHVLLFLAWFFLYLSSYPFLQAVKRPAKRSHFLKWGSAYGAVALVCLVIPLWKHPVLLFLGLPLAVLLLINVWHVMHKKERSLFNDLCAFLLFSLGGAAAYLVGTGEWDRSLSAVILFNFLFFTGSALFVKTLFREKGDPRWLLAARIYHGALLFVPWLVGYPLMFFSFVFPAARAFVFSGKNLKPMHAGIIEIVNSVLFLLLSVTAFSLYK
ncbi:YwiC-like family protein [Gorillibacterium massiliense]|uniref:YwiC-like family protein n=1 Tax=Gorillibacterium massiliense TaxID=1280390 RepID=UPI00059499F9|nr:YwiC-like family protein [Gorillibacterium massiliense]